MLRKHIVWRIAAGRKSVCVFPYLDTDLVISLFLTRVVPV